MRRVFNDIIINDRNSFGVAVRARRLIEYSSTEDLREIFDTTLNDNTPWRVLSGGNNILFTQDVECTLLTPTNCSIEVVDENPSTIKIRVEAGAEWDDVVEWCVQRGVWGIENLSLIPGKMGAAPIQNIGAYGVEVCDVIVEVEAFNTLTKRLVTYTREECEFGYRDSIFKRSLKSTAIITSVTLELSKEPNAQLNYADVSARIAARGEVNLRNIREVICEIRREKLPDTKVMGNAGSFFKNPIVEVSQAEELKLQYPNIPIYNTPHPSQRKIAAGWLIEQAGMKGYREGAVGVHERQALVLVNHGGATGAQIIAFAHKVARIVEEKFGIEIESEVNII